MVAYALLVIDELLFTYREAVRSSENEKWKRAMDDEMQSIQKKSTLGVDLTTKKQIRQLGANGYLQRKKNFLIRSTLKQDWWQKVTLKIKELITMRCFL